MVNKNLFITCKESRIENNRSFYGCFNLGPFDSGQSLTVANALRRTLLSDCTGIGIVSVSIDTVTHEYCTLPGMRESVLDLILNLKEVVLKKKTNNLSLYKKNSTIYNQIGASYFKPVSGFLKVKGPGVIRAKDLKLPPFLSCVDPDQYIATLAEDGFLCLKFIIMEGKGYLLQNQKQNQNLFSGSLKISNNINTVSKKTNYVKKRLSFLKDIKKNVVDLSPTTIKLGFQGEESNERTENKDPALLKGLGMEPLTKSNIANDKLNDKLNEKIKFFENKKPAFLKKEDARLGNKLENTKNENSSANANLKDPNQRPLKEIRAFQTGTYLNLDTVFNPITKVSYIIEEFDNKIVDDLNQKVTFMNEISTLIESNVILHEKLPFLTKEISLNQNEIYKFVDSCSMSEIRQFSQFLHPLKRNTVQHNIVLEIWTNGSLHPRDALYGAFNNLSSSFLNLQKTQNYNPIFINESSLPFIFES